MALIDKCTFKVYSEIFNPNEKNNAFDCDDVIAPAIRILNLKGYTTTYCCSGHPYPAKIELLSYLKSIEEVYSAYPGVYGVKEVTLDDLKDSIYYDEASYLINSNTNRRDGHLYFVKAIQRVDNNCYIVFEKGKRPKKLPKGWKCDEDDENTIRRIIKYKSDINFFKKQIAVMEKLVKWAKALPMYK